MFDKVPGVLETWVGYTGQHYVNVRCAAQCLCMPWVVCGPSYSAVCSGSGHTEAVMIKYDKSKVSYEGLINAFWQCHNSQRVAPQQYKSVIYYDPSEKQAAKQCLASYKVSHFEGGGDCVPLSLGTSSSCLGYFSLVSFRYVLCSSSFLSCFILPVGSYVAGSPCQSPPSWNRAPPSGRQRSTTKSMSKRNGSVVVLPT